MIKSIASFSFSSLKSRKKAPLTRQQLNDETSPTSIPTTISKGKDESLIRRLSRSLKGTISWSKKKTETDISTSTPDLYVNSESDSADVLMHKKSDIFSVVTNFDSATSRSSHSKSPSESIHDDERKQIKRRSSLSSTKSTPMQLLCSRADQMLPNKAITDSTNILVKQIVSNVETDSSSTDSGMGSKSEVTLTTLDNCDKIIESVANVWTSSLQDIPYEKLTKKSLIFAMKKKASIDLKTYMTRLVRIMNKVYDESAYSRDGTGIRCLLISTIYIERILNLNDDLELSEKNIHRLFLGAFMLALKMYEDEIPYEESLAEYGGVSVAQLHLIEAKFFELVKFRLVVTTEEFLTLFSKTQVLSEINFRPDIPSWIGLDNKF